MFKTGLICKKTAGLDKGKFCIVLERKKNFAIIDGECRGKCNIKHLEPVSFAEIKKNASHEEILKVLEVAGFKSHTRKWKRKIEKKIEKNEHKKK
ncbi:50S ribosomal protein L14e [Candidatus Pacearchaeota archaeon ex4484_26]|nr:MAG: 50S ribosomal protein L14e [Candidatus Pacearchaeota archaeon ex4484_26]RLG10825.1 MAG: 50S ribosomal protein L14e [Candidatus Pacearchaeota archaeon]